MKRCRNCGKSYNDKMKFCVVCGTELTEDEMKAEGVSEGAGTAVTTAEAESEETAEALPEEIFTEEFPPEDVITEKETEDVYRKEVTAEELFPQEVAAEEVYPKEVAPEDLFPKEIAAEDVYPKEVAPDDLFPKEIAAEEVYPQEVAVEEAYPKEVTAEDIFPHEVTAEEVHPQEVTPEEYREPIETEATPPEYFETETVPITEAKPKLTLRRVLAGLLSAILGVVCFAVLTAAGVSYTARYLSYGGTVESIIANIDILNLPLDDTPMGEAGDTVLDVVYASSDGMGLSEEDIRSIYEDATFREDLARLIALYTDFIRTGEYPAAVTTDTIKGIFEDNIDVINRVLARAGEPPLNNIDHAMVLASIDTADDMLKTISFENLSRSDSLINPVGLIRIAISQTAIIAELAAAFIIILIIGAVSKSVRTPLFIGGLSLTLSGAVLASALYLFENSAIVVVQNNAVQIVLSDIARYLGGEIYGICGIAALTGVVMIAVSQIKIKKRAAI